MLSEESLDGDGFEPVVRRSARAVRADVAYLFGANVALVERLPHGARRAVAFGVRRCHVVRVARKPVACHLSVDARAARTRALQRLKHKDARALAWNHSLAVAVKGLAS